MEKKFKTAQEVAAEFWRTNDIQALLPPNNKEEYDKIPVCWCSVCKSLHIINDTEPDPKYGVEYYCANCGNVEIEEGNINEWLEINKVNK